MDVKVARFLEELSELSKKHGMTIGGCGCCDSPYIYSKDSSTAVVSALGWDYKNEKYKEDDYI